MRAWVIFSTDAGLAVTTQIAFRPPRADNHSVTSNLVRSTVYWRKVGDAGPPGFHFGVKLLKSLALPRGLEPLFSP